MPEKKVTKATLDKFQPRFLIWPYRWPSASFRVLADVMDWPVKTGRAADYVFSEKEGFGDGLVLINWGSRNIPSSVARKARHIINHPRKVADVSNKITFFQTMEKAGVRIPEFTTDMAVAEDWLERGAEVFGRQTHGHSGTDIAVFADNPEGFTTSEFWVKYKKKKAEFRVHVVDKENPSILAVQQKVLRKEGPNGEEIDRSLVNFKIRNHKNGFIFQRNNLSPPRDVLDVAVEAFKATGLDFAALDVIYNEKEDKAYVLEANTAPGLEGQTVEEYARFFEGTVRRYA